MRSMAYRVKGRSEDEDRHIIRYHNERRIMNRAPSPNVASDHPIRVLLVDDHDLVCDAVSSLLSKEQNIDVVGTVNCAAAAVTEAVRSCPDVVLMDISMPGLSCFDAIRIIRSRRPNTRFILVSAYSRDRHLEDALSAKVDGFVMKHEGVSALVEAVRSVAAGAAYFAPDIMNRLVEKADAIDRACLPKSGLNALSPRERELLRVLAQGPALKESASILGVSFKTADKQKTSIMAKLDIHDRVELAHFAIREGLVEP